MTLAGILQIVLFFGILLLLTKPLGSYMARVFGGERTFLPRHLHLAEADRRHDRRQPPRHRLGWPHAGAEIDQRRAQHHARKSGAPTGCGAQCDQRAQRVRQPEVGRRTIGQHHLLEEGFKVAVVLGERIDVCLRPVMEPPVGSALPAPVERGDCVAPSPQVADHLEIFLDRIAQPLQQADRAERPPAAAAPAREARGDAVAGHDAADDSAFRNGIALDGGKLHGVSA